MNMTTIPGDTTHTEILHRHPAWQRIPAHFISWMFHPIFIPVYGTAFLLFVHPYVFSGFSSLFKWQRLGTVFVNMTFIPGFAVFLMWRLGLIQSMKLRTAKERIIPYAGAIIFYFWGFYVMSRQPDSPAPFVDLLQGSFLSVCGAWIININSKISMHSTAASAIVVFMLLFSFSDPFFSFLYLSITILIAGAIVVARNIVSDHSLLEIIQGLVIGAIAMLIAWWI
jgi:hypothetical protein